MEKASKSRFRFLFSTCKVRTKSNIFGRPPQDCRHDPERLASGPSSGYPLAQLVWQRYPPHPPKGHFNFSRNYRQEINLGKRTRVGSTGRKAKPVTLAT